MRNSRDKGEHQLKEELETTKVRTSNITSSHAAYL